MANYKLVDGDQLDADLKAVADKIREKGNTTDELAFPQGYTDAIDAIKTGGGGGAVQNKGYVNFYDYEGTLLYSYSKEETEALTELPPLPSHDGLVCQGWNWSLEDIKAEGKETDVGATYITDDGKTRLYITIAAEGRMDVPLYFQQTVANGVTIDWGDGSATETLSGTGKVNTVHTYASIGDYVISLDVVDGCTLQLGHNASAYCVMGSSGNYGRVYCNMLRKVEIGSRVTSIGNYNFANCNSLVSITIPDGVTSIGTYTFNFCYSLTSITIPDGVTSIGNVDFSYCNSLASITIPDGVTSIGNGAFQYCYALASITIPESVTSISNTAFKNCNSLVSITIPDGVTSIGTEVFHNCYSFTSITIPDGVTSIGNEVFRYCYGMKFYDFTKHTTVPTLANANAFQGIPSDCEIRVPAALYDEWIAATNWSTLASQTVAK